jgi:glycosyltransferase involved in cell wall biosynthesis
MPNLTSPFIVITPVLNGAQFLSKALESVDRQNDGDWIHYIVDGGSTDGSQEIARASARSDPRRRLIEGSDSGIYDAIFKGFDRARDHGFSDPASICLWLNADDMLMPWAFSTLRAASARTRAQWITALPCFWDQEGRMSCLLPYGWYPRSFIRWGLFQENALGPIQQESTFFTRGLLDQLPGSSRAAIRAMKWAGDFELWRAFARIAAPVSLPLPLSGFRMHGRNASVRNKDAYDAEIAAAGAPVIGRPFGKLLRLLFRPVAITKFVIGTRRQWLRIA